MGQGADRKANLLQTHGNEAAVLIVHAEISASWLRHSGGGHGHRFTRCSIQYVIISVSRLQTAVSEPASPRPTPAVMGGHSVPSPATAQPRPQPSHSGSYRTEAARKKGEERQLERERSPTAYVLYLHTPFSPAPAERRISNSPPPELLLFLRGKDVKQGKGFEAGGPR